MTRKIKYLICAVSMILAIFIMVLFVLPKLDRDNRNTEIKKVFSTYTPVCTITMGEGGDMYYRYSFDPLETLSPVKFYVAGNDGEFILYDEMSNRILVYDGNDLRFRYEFDDSCKPSEVHCLEETYVVNCLNHAGNEYYKSVVLDKSGSFVETGKWYTGNRKEVATDAVALIDKIGSDEAVTFAGLIKIDEDGNYYIRESRTVSLEEGYAYYEYCISKYNSKGERIAYAIYNYSGKEGLRCDIDDYIQMDDEDNIYVINFFRDNIIINQVTLGQDDEDYRAKRCAAYIEMVNRYKLNEADFEEEPSVDWLEILDEQVSIESMPEFDGLTEGDRGYIMEINDGEIVMELIYYVKAYPYELGDIYVEYSQDRKAYKLAENVKVLAWALYGENRLGIMKVDDIIDYERLYRYGHKAEWIVYLNKNGEVEYILEPYMP